MTSFSQCQRLKPVSKALQLEGMDIELRNSLWNALFTTYWKKGFNIWESDLFFKYWVSYFKKPMDEMSLGRGGNPELTIIKNYFFECKWNEVYDFIEFTIRNGDKRFQSYFSHVCNLYLERENSGCRIVGLEIIPITSSYEIEAIEEALAVGLKSVEDHFASALREEYDIHY